MPFPWPAAAAFAAETAFFLLYQHFKRKPGVTRAVSTALKTAATLCAAALCLYGAVKSGGAAWLLFSGLMVCAAADWIINYDLVKGMGVFGLGHVFYCAGYIIGSPPTLWSLAVTAALAAACLALYPKRKAYAGKRNPRLFLAYALLLCVMVGLAVPQGPVLFAGAALFALSDGLLGRRMMYGISSRRYDHLCLGVYYLAQFLIALSAVL